MRFSASTTTYCDTWTRQTLKSEQIQSEYHNRMQATKRGLTCPRSPATVAIRPTAIVDAEAMGQEGVLAQNAGDYELAIYHYTQAISLRPPSRGLVVSLLLNRAVALYAVSPIRRNPICLPC